MEIKGGLGKGLSALFDQKNVDMNAISKIAEQDKVLFEVEIDKIKVNPFQPREDFNEDKLKELADSIKTKGLLQPVTVKISADKTGFDLISGERRVRAVKKLGYKTIPAYLYKTEDNSKENMLELALIENIQRDDLNPMELSDSFQRLLDECDLTQEEIAEKVSKQRSTVANYLRLQKLPIDIKISLRKGEISEAHARTLLRVDDIDEQIILWKKIISDSMSVRQLENITKPHAKPKKKKDSSKLRENDSYYKSVEEKLRLFFGTQVKVKSKTKFTGEIIIEYYSDDDIERILEKTEK
ncbi:MAG: ParB/RepB/Spo0J family partition protein [Ignavibacteriae bacterium]|nr:ParB/RepB/Spo0J family partition protein [Ignavibacteriota bacterium]